MRGLLLILLQLMLLLLANMMLMSGEFKSFAVMIELGIMRPNLLRPSKSDRPMYRTLAIISGFSLLFVQKSTGN